MDMYRHRKEMVNLDTLVLAPAIQTQKTYNPACVSVVHPLFLVIRKRLMVGVPIKPRVWIEGAPKIEIKMSQGFIEAFTKCQQLFLS